MDYIINVKLAECMTDDRKIIFSVKTVKNDSEVNNLSFTYTQGLRVQPEE